jgi:hypothetical protein
VISKQEQVQIRLLSENELYTQAIALIKGLSKSLPPSQINGLLNVSLSCTYQELQDFVTAQNRRSTWSSRDAHIPGFYGALAPRIKQLERYADTIAAKRTEQASQADKDALTMALVREYIQHLLGANAYKEALEKTKREEGAHQRPDQRSGGQGGNGGRRGEEPKKSMHKGGR